MWVLSALDEDHVAVRYQMRSSFESKKQEMRAEIERCCKAVGAEAVINGEYPAWQYNPESKLQKLMSDIYEDMYGKKAVVFATHSGLECGFFMDKCPGLDCVSMGPDMLDVHSFNEKTGYCFYRENMGLSESNSCEIKRIRSI